jgi:hypothetical protein
MTRRSIRATVLKTAYPTLRNRAGAATLPCKMPDQTNLGGLIMDMRAAACILVTVASVGAASAHHGWGSYDATKVFTINAPVETLTWADPHTHITVKYQGNVWEATLAPLFRMQARGLTQEMLKPGTIVAVDGYPSTQKEHEMRAERITVAGKAVELR